jgi:hypothetical protein
LVAGIALRGVVNVDGPAIFRVAIYCSAYGALVSKPIGRSHMATILAQCSQGHKLSDAAPHFIFRRRHSWQDLWALLTQWGIKVSENYQLTLLLFRGRFLGVINESILYMVLANGSVSELLLTFPRKLRWGHRGWSLVDVELAKGTHLAQWLMDESLEYRDVLSQARARRRG